MPYNQFLFFIIPVTIFSKGLIINSTSNALYNFLKLNLIGSKAALFWDNYPASGSGAEQSDSYFYLLISFIGDIKQVQEQYRNSRNKMTGSNGCCAKRDNETHARRNPLTPLPSQRPLSRLSGDKKGTGESEMTRGALPIVPPRPLFLQFPFLTFRSYSLYEGASAEEPALTLKVTIDCNGIVYRDV